MPTSRKLPVPTILLAVLLFLNGCEAFLTHRGGEGEPCFGDGSCAAGLSCNGNNICVGESGRLNGQDSDTDGVPDGTFAARLSYPAPAGASWVAAGHLNADAVPDLVVTNASAGSVSVYTGGGSCWP